MVCDMPKVSPKISIPGTEAIRIVIHDDGRVQLVLINRVDGVQVVPVTMRPVACERKVAA